MTFHVYGFLIVLPKITLVRQAVTATSPDDAKQKALAITHSRQWPLTVSWTTASEAKSRSVPTPE